MNRLPLATVLLLAMLSACARHGGSTASVVRDSVTPRFETRIEIATGTGLHADYVVADLDNDRQVDMAVIGLSGELQIMIGSNGVFAPGQRIQLGGVPLWIDRGDIDGDGDQDLAVLRTDIGEVSLLLNDGNAQFSPGPVLPIGPEALAVVIADADDDGVLDIIVSRPGVPAIMVFLNDGSGVFTSGSSFNLPGGGSPFTMVVGDVTRDNRKDLVVSDPERSRVLIYPGSTSAVDFDPVPYELAVPGAPKACSLGDLSGDGNTDLAVSAYEAHEFVVITDMLLPAGGGPTSYTSTSIPISGPPSLSVIGDVTGDGLADLSACVVSRAAMVIVPQRAGGGFDEPQQLDATGLPLRPVLADADNNGRLDLFVLSGLNNRINLWLARNTGELVGARNYDTGLTTAAYSQVADLDGDGRPEVIVGNNFDTRLAILGDRGDGALQVEATLELGADVFNVRLADLDVDGRMDILVPVSNGVKVVQNLSTPGNLNLIVRPGIGALSFGSGSGPFGVTAADLNRDGRNDLAIVNFASGELQLLMGGATAFDFESPRILSIGSGPIDVVAGEFTGDGIVDLAVSRVSQSDIVIFENDGAADLAMLVSLPVGASPNYLLTSDFNRDGRTDLVVSNGHDESISVLFGSASGFSRENYPAGRTPTALLAGDMTGDGVPDILVTSLSGGDFRVLVNGGDGAFTNILPFPGTSGASGAAMGDLDGDGDDDLVIASMITNRVSVVRSLLSSR